MAKSSKKSKEASAVDHNPLTTGMESSNGNGTAKPVKAASAKKTATKSSPAAKTAPKPRRGADRKSAGTRQPATKTAPASAKSGAPAPTDEEIRTRAYFIAERRMQEGRTGDSAHDWIEARRQLLEEAGQSA